MIKLKIEGEHEQLLKVLAAKRDMTPLRCVHAMLESANTGDDWVHPSKVKKTVQRICRECGGAGYVGSAPSLRDCPKCRGTGYVQVEVDNA